MMYIYRDDWCTYRLFLEGLVTNVLYSGHQHKSKFCGSVSISSLHELANDVELLVYKFIAKIGLFWRAYLEKMLEASSLKGYQAFCGSSNMIFYKTLDVLSWWKLNFEYEPAFSDLVSFIQTSSMKMNMKMKWNRSNRKAGLGHLMVSPSLDACTCRLKTRNKLNAKNIVLYIDIGFTSYDTDTLTNSRVDVKSLYESPTNASNISAYSLEASPTGSFVVTLFKLPAWIITMPYSSWYVNS